MAVRPRLFEESVRETREWVLDLMERLHFADEYYAVRGLTAVLQALRDELSADQNASLAAQMPVILRGIYFQSWKPAALEPKHSSRDAFLTRVDSAFSKYESAPDPRELVEHVFALLESRISGECRKIRRTLPGDLRGLWPAAESDLDEQ